jgi:hypothetical protein
MKYGYFGDPWSYKVATYNSNDCINKINVYTSASGINGMDFFSALNVPFDLVGFATGTLNTMLPAVTNGCLCGVDSYTNASNKLVLITAWWCKYV